MPYDFTLTPRDPLIARDSRPFGADAGNRMRSLNWLYPSVLAGSLRTLLGKRVGGFDPSKLKSIAVQGPFPLLNGEMFFPRPVDCVVRNQNGDRECFAARPADFMRGEGWDLDMPGLLPALLPEDVPEFKPAEVPGFWSYVKLTEWLTNPDGKTFAAPEKGDGSYGFLNLPEKEVRVHVQMDRVSGTGKNEDALFMTTGLDLNRKCSAEPVRIALRVQSAGDYVEQLTGLDCLHPLGGERRLVHWKAGTEAKGWTRPESIRTALNTAKCVRMVLATPAIFECGWKPGWLRETSSGLEGVPPGTKVKLRLVDAIVERWQPLSGWSLEDGRVGPKPIRRMVPAGSVYFFEVAEGDASALADCWLQSVCDSDQDRLDGFGLALWGVWSAHKQFQGER